MATVGIFKMVASLIVVSLVLHTTMCVPPEETEPSSNSEYYNGINEMLQSIDPSVDPCVDFYKFACGNWPKRQSTRAPGGESHIDTTSIMRTDLMNKLRDLLEEEINTEDGEAVAKAKRIYRSCMDGTRIDQLGARPLIRLLNSRLGGWPLLRTSSSSSSSSSGGSDDNWVKLMGTLRLYNNEIIIGQTVESHPDSTRPVILLYPASLGMPVPEYFNPISRQFAAYERYLLRTARLLGGASNANLESDIRDILNFEINLAKIFLVHKGEDKIRHTKLDIVKLKSDLPNINWALYLETAFYGITLKETDRIDLYNWRYFVDVSDLISKTENKNIIINYLIWRFVMNRVDSLGTPFAASKYQFEAEISGITTAAPRYMACVELVNKNMGLAVSSLYVNRYFENESKEQVADMIVSIAKATIKILRKSNWMDEDTWNYAKKKSMLMLHHVGAPEWITNPDRLAKEYRHLDFNQDAFFENVIRITRSNAKETRFKLRQHKERDQWVVLPTSTDAGYSLERNLISVPAGILQPPLFHPHYPRSLKYGAIGSIIGQELSRAFNYHGRNYDHQGDLQHWWSPTTIDQYVRQVKCMEEQYNKYKVIIGEDTIPVSGTGTLAENVADQAGVKVAYLAYLIDEKQNGAEYVWPGLGLTHHQMFFIKYAQNWCQNLTPQLMKDAIKSWRNPFGEIRVTGTLSNLEEFSKAFNCRADHPMNLPDKCNVW